MIDIAGLRQRATNAIEVVKNDGIGIVGVSGEQMHELLDALDRVLMLEARLAAMTTARDEACAIAELGFDIDYGFNYEASIAPRERIAVLRKVGV